MPPAGASGQICPIQRPLVPPENLPSVIKATCLPKPLPTIADVGESISLIPGPPFGPSYLITTTSPATILSSIIACIASSSELKVLALPVNTNASLSTPEILTTAPSGAKLPCNTAKPGLDVNGSDIGLITSLSHQISEAAISDNLIPETPTVSFISVTFP